MGIQLFISQRNKEFNQITVNGITPPPTIITLTIIAMGVILELLNRAVMK